MRVVSGAGEFELQVDDVFVRDGSIVLSGKMGVWESETFITAEELAALLRTSLNGPTAAYLARRLPGALWRALRARPGQEPHGPNS